MNYVQQRGIFNNSPAVKSVKENKQACFLVIKNRHKHENEDAVT